MFLTKKALFKILIVIACYVVLGSICLGVSFYFAYLGLDGDVLFVLGIIMYVLCPIFALLIRFSEGKAKLFNLANKLVLNELKPAEFIKEYWRLKTSSDLIVNKPDAQILQMLALAYDTLDDRKNSIAAADEMIAASSEKKRTQAKLVKASLLYSYGMNEEAEAIFLEAQASNPGLLCQATIDNIMKSDRAMAMGDYKTVEAYCLKALVQTFPKPHNLSKLVLNFKLGEVYEKLENREKAILHYSYCVENGGQTAMREAAREAIISFRNTALN